MYLYTILSSLRLHQYRHLRPQAQKKPSDPKTLNTHRNLKQNHMTYPFAFKPLRDQISYKQNEAHLMEARDRLCAHYKLNKSDMMKYLIKKEDYNLRKPNGLLEVI